MPFEILRNDITNMQVDAIVNTANPNPVIGSGTDAAIHAKAGPMLLLVRKCIGRLETGAAVMTPGFRLPAKYVIHTVGPVWRGGSHGEEELLRRCYRNALELARKKRLKSVAFPLISTGNYGFPKPLALKTATDVIREFLKEQDMEVFLVVFGRDSFQLSQTLQQEISSFIDDWYVREQMAKEYSFTVCDEYEPVGQTLDIASWPEEEATPGISLPYAPERRPRDEFDGEPDWWEVPQFRGVSAPCPAAPRRDYEDTGWSAEPEKTLAPAVSLEQMLKEQDEGFSATLLNLIDKTGKSDADIYRRANISRQHFSKIRKNPNYQPTKSTALAFAIALELDLEQTNDLIGRAGFALTRSSKSDLIIMYFIQKRHYDILDINTALFEFDQSLLGA